MVITNELRTKEITELGFELLDIREKAILEGDFNTAEEALRRFLEIQREYLSLSANSG